MSQREHAPHREHAPQREHAPHREHDEDREHDARVSAIAGRIRSRSSADGFASLRKLGVSHYVPDPHDPRHTDRKLDVRELCSILAVDPERRVCTAEPGVTFVDLLRVTLPLGLAPTMVPELETITLGGAVAGCAVESMAHRHGGFHDSCLEYELITGAGEVITCSPERDRESFEMMHGSYGTLGVLTKLTFGLIEVKPYVRLEYQRFTSFEALRRAMMERCDRDDVDFVDAIGHGPEHFELCLGRLVDDAPYTSDYRGAKIYYRSTAERREDYLTTFDYYFRYDADCHWATSTIPGMRSALLRRLFGWLFLGSTKLLTWARWLRPIERHKARLPVVTDVFIPQSRVAEFFDWYRTKIGHFPLWLVPYRMPGPYPFIAEAHRAKTEDDLYVDFAIYGLPNEQPDVDYSEMLETKTRELGGIKTLIGENHYDERTFYEVYDRAAYERVKRRHDPDNVFRDVYDKRVRHHRRREHARDEARAERGSTGAPRSAPQAVGSD